MNLGFSHGIRLSFVDGFLASVLVDLHRKPPLIVREHLLAAGVTPEPLPPTEVPTMRARQGLGIGTRELELIESRNGGEVSARLSQRFHLRSPLDWLLAIDAPGHVTERGVMFVLPRRVTLFVESPASCVVVPGGVRVSLASGTSELTVTVTTEPVFDVADTAVVCRPDQVREAAIVASCLPADRFTPIISIEPPPMPQEAYVELYARFHRAAETSMRRIGGPIGLAALSDDPEAGKQALAEIREMLRLRRALSSYRSWLKHNELMSDLVHRLRVRRVVFLHDFQPEELNATDPALLAKQNKVRAALGRDTPDPVSSLMFARVPETLRLPCTDLPGLTAAAWRLLCDPDSEPDRLLDVAISDLTGWVAALFVALQTGAVLRAVNHAVTAYDPLSVEDSNGQDEAVLVENTADPAALLGSVYAHHRGARLVVTPPPNLKTVQQAVAEQQERVLAGARAVGSDLTSIGFVEKLWRYLSAGGRDPYAAVETAVTAQVPGTAVVQVGERKLTAFTTGLPYSFVRTADADWSAKPIGHIAADPALLILNELYSAGIERSPGTFSLVFDPGFFRTSETPAVLHSVSTHFTHPILLSGPDASSRALMDLSEDLPVELIFFNTHGSDEAIVLGDLELDSSVIPQWLRLNHRPIVFNNSCQSWTGVGRQFVRAGARGYIGTLWSIPSRPAADFARIVVDRLTAREQPAAEAIVGTGLASGIERSYIYVGTVNGRLDQWRDRSATAAEAALAECAILATARTATQRSPIRLLRNEIATLRQQAEGTAYESTESYVDVLLRELALFTALDLHEKDDRTAAHELTRRIDRVLEKLDLPQADLDRRWAQRFDISGRLASRWSEWGTALADFRRSIGYGEACANRADLLLHMATITIWLGHPEDALALVSSAHDTYAGQDDRAGLLSAVGVLGQLNARLGRHKDAMEYAKEGYETAVTFEDAWRQAVFKIDQSGLHQIAGDFDAAIAAATQALELSRVVHNDEAELAAIGRLAECHLDRGDLDAAQRYATTGLGHATQLRVPKQAAGFHYDLGRVAASHGRLDKAVDHYKQAVTIAVDASLWEAASVPVTDLAAVAARIPDVDALWSVAAWGTALCGLLSERLWSTLLPSVVDALKRAVRTGPVATTRHGLVAVAEAAKPGVEQDSVPSTFVYHLTVTLALWVAGENPIETAAAAHMLDVQTGGVFALRMFVDTPYGPPNVSSDDRGHRHRRWRSRG